MAEIGDDIGIEPRGDKFAVYVTIGGVRSELVITENDIVYFSRLFPSFLRRILERRNLSDGIGASAAVPVTSAAVNDDLHGMEGILRIQDIAGGDFEWSLSADQARNLGNLLIALADKIDRESGSRSAH